MSNLIPFPSRHVTREQAGHWLARLDRGLSTEERKELDAWLAGNPRHSQSLIEMGALWDEMEVLSELSGLLPLDQHAVPRRRRLIRLLAATAACSMLAFISWFSLTRVGTSLEFGQPVAASNLVTGTTYETAIGEQLSVMLADGSHVTLNTNTLLEVQYTATERVVLLRRGESHFAVAHNPGRPFTVQAGKHIVQAIGTAFNVQLSPAEEVEVVVTEGRVRVTATSGNAPPSAVDGEPARLPAETTVAAGEMALMAGGVESVRILPPEEIAIRLSWQRGMLEFRGEPLLSVLEEVSRHTAVDFVLADPGLREVRVGGYFYPNDIEGLLVALENNFQITAHREGSDRIILTRQE